jgi:glycosyltransferase involved in cell wall biosynthesis
MRPLASALVNLVEKSISRLCDLIVTADDATAETFDSNGVPVVTLYNFPPLELFRSDPDLESTLREEYKGRVIVVCQGSMDKDRGLFHMIRAMKPLKMSISNILLLLIGLHEEPLRQMANNLAAKLNVQDSIKVIPWVNHVHMASYMRISKLGLIPLQPVEKYKRNIPIKLFEYMACGIPVLAADLPPVAHYIRESGAGRVYDSTSIEALSTNVGQMLSDEQDWRRMSENGSRAVREKWNWEPMEERLLNVYANVETDISQRHRVSSRSSNG